MQHEDIEHKQELIRIYTRRLRVLEKQQATQGYQASPETVTEIEDIKKQIAGLSKELTELAIHNASTPEYQLEPLLPPLQQYDGIFQRLSQALAQIDWRHGPYETDILRCLCFAARAELSFVVQYHPQPWKIIAKSSDSADEVQALLEKGTHTHRMILQIINEKRTMIGYKTDSANITLFVPYPEKNPSKVLVIHNIEALFRPSIIIERAIHALLSATNNFEIRKPGTYIESEIHNALKSEFGYVSDAMYERQFNLFKDRLEKIGMHFEPIISLSKYQIYLWGWEALAREPGARQAPADLFKTAELWGKRFQLELDMYCLRTAVLSYGPNRRLRSNEVMPISVNVYPVSLLRTRYLETIQQIGQDRKIPLDVLTLEISEKIPIPAPEEPVPNKSPMEAFVARLREFKKLRVRFAIDDFGVGYSSSARLSRIGPAFIKVDRDALLDPFGHLTVKYAVDVAEGLPGDIGVVVEGFDKDSRILLQDLVDLGVQYIQGHRIGEAIKFDPDAKLERLNRLPEKTWGELCKELGISVDKSH